MRILSKRIDACVMVFPENVENVMGCGVTSVRLVSSGIFENSVTVAVRPANENDIMDANLICGV